MSKKKISYFKIRFLRPQLLQSSIISWSKFDPNPNIDYRFLKQQQASNKEIIQLKSISYPETYKILENTLENWNWIEITFKAYSKWIRIMDCNINRKKNKRIQKKFFQNIKNNRILLQVKNKQIRKKSRFFSSASRHFTGSFGYLKMNSISRLIFKWLSERCVACVQWNYSSLLI